MFTMIHLYRVGLFTAHVMEENHDLKFTDLKLVSVQSISASEKIN